MEDWYSKCSLLEEFISRVHRLPREGEVYKGVNLYSWFMEQRSSNLEDSQVIALSDAVPYYMGSVEDINSMLIGLVVKEEFLKGYYDKAVLLKGYSTILSLGVDKLSDSYLKNCDYHYIHDMFVRGSVDLILDLYYELPKLFGLACDCNAVVLLHDFFLTQEGKSIVDRLETFRGIYYRLDDNFYSYSKEVVGYCSKVSDLFLSAIVRARYSLEGVSLPVNNAVSSVLSKYFYRINGNI